jgi:hypothetical protein
MAGNQAKSENSTGTLVQEFLPLKTVATDRLERMGIGLLTSLRRLGQAIAAKEAAAMR